MRRVLREPLLHFLLLGAAIFGFHHWMSRGSTGVEPSREIQLTPDDLTQLELYFESQWRRPPTPEELDRMVESKIQLVSRPTWTATARRSSGSPADEQRAAVGE